MIDQPPGWGKSYACDRCPQAGRSRIGYQVSTMGNDLEDASVEVLIMSSVQSVRPPSVRVSGRAQAELRAGETLVFDWTSLAFCCAVAGEISLRPTTLQEAQRPSAYVPIRSDDGPLLFAIGRPTRCWSAAPSKSTVDAAWASARSPPCRQTWGCVPRSDARPEPDGDRRESPASGPAAPLG
jgi:hypothetical protein